MSDLSLWQSIKDRLLKYDTLHGLYMVPLGIIGVIVTLWHLQYILHVIGALVFMYAIVEGIRKIWANPIKYAAKLSALKQKYTHLFEDTNAK